MLPYDRYVRYLITCGQDLPDIQDNLKNLCLAPIDELQYVTVYKEMLEGRVPKDVKNYWKDPKKAKPPKDYAKLMKDLKLEDAHLQTSVWKQTVMFAQNEPAILAIQAMLIKGIEAVELAALASSRFNLRCEPAHIKMYEEYFFNVQVMSKTDWRNYFNSADSTLKAHLIDCFKLDTEALRAAHGLPTKMSFVASLQEMHLLSMTRFREAVKDRTPESDRNARNWANLAMSSGAQYEKFRTKDLTDFSKEVQMEFEYVETKYPTMEELNNISDDKAGSDD